MKLLLLAVGQRQPAWAEVAYGEFAKRFPPEMPLALKAVKAEPRGARTPEQLMAAEAARLLAACPKGARRVVLDEHGDRLTTLQMAKRKHPMTSNSLDALCRRYGVDASKRTKHGALLDSELLAEVYLQLIGGRQTALGLAAPKKSEMPRINSADATAIATRPRSLPGRLDAKQLQDHEKMLDSMGGKALWRSDA